MRTRLVKITTDDGIVGWGEATLEGKPKSTLGAVEDLSDLLIGKDPLRIEFNWAWTGVLEGNSADAAILATAGRANRNGEPVQGSLADFVVDQALMINSKRVIPAHHDNWLPGFTHAVDVKPIRECFARRASYIDFCEIGYASQFPLFVSD